MSQDDFQSPKALARFILREALFGFLATEGEKGYPFASAVGVAALADGSPAILLPDFARHAFNVRKDPRVSLLLLERPQAADPLAVARLTVTGVAAEIEKEGVRGRYLARHPEAAKNADFRDSTFWKITVERAHLIAAQGKMSDLMPGELVGYGVAAAG